MAAAVADDRDVHNHFFGAEISASCLEELFPIEAKTFRITGDRLNELAPIFKELCMRDEEEEGRALMLGDLTGELLLWLRILSAPSSARLRECKRRFLSRLFRLYSANDQSVSADGSCDIGTHGDDNSEITAPPITTDQAGELPGVSAEAGLTGSPTLPVPLLIRESSALTDCDARMKLEVSDPTIKSEIVDPAYDRIAAPSSYAVSVTQPLSLADWEDDKISLEADLLRTNFSDTQNPESAHKYGTRSKAVPSHPCTPVGIRGNLYHCPCCQYKTQFPTTALVRHVRTHPGRQVYITPDQFTCDACAKPIGCTHAVEKKCRLSDVCGNPAYCVCDQAESAASSPAYPTDVYVDSTGSVVDVSEAGQESDGALDSSGSESSDGERYVQPTAEFFRLRDAALPYQCYFCDYSTSLPTEINEHVGATHVDRCRYGCRYCRLFEAKRKANWSSHMLNTHNVCTHIIDKVQPRNPLLCTRVDGKGGGDSVEYSFAGLLVLDLDPFSICESCELKCQVKAEFCKPRKRKHDEKSSGGMRGSREDEGDESDGEQSSDADTATSAPGAADDAASADGSDDSEYVTEDSDDSSVYGDDDADEDYRPPTKEPRLATSKPPAVSPTSPAPPVTPSSPDKLSPNGVRPIQPRIQPKLLPYPTVVTAAGAVVTTAGGSKPFSYAVNPRTPINNSGSRPVVIRTFKSATSSSPTMKVITNPPGFSSRQTTGLTPSSITTLWPRGAVFSNALVSHRSNAAVYKVAGSGPVVGKVVGTVAAGGEVVGSGMSGTKVMLATGADGKRVLLVSDAKEASKGERGDAAPLSRPKLAPLPGRALAAGNQQGRLLLKVGSSAATPTPAIIKLATPINQSRPAAAASAHPLPAASRVVTVVYPAPPASRPAAGAPRIVGITSRPVGRPRGPVALKVGAVGPLSPLKVTTRDEATTRGQTVAIRTQTTVATSALLPNTGNQPNVKRGSLPDSIVIAPAQLSTTPTQGPVLLPKVFPPASVVQVPRSAVVSVTPHTNTRSAVISVTPTNTAGAPATVSGSVTTPSQISRLKHPTPSKPPQPSQKL